MAAAAETVPPRPTLDPSKSIRICVHRRQASLSSYQTTCISKHYALNNQILTAFESNYQNRLWPVAYEFGLKFVETALLEIPKHGYFYSDKFAHLRLQSTVDAMRVCHMLQEIIAKQPEDLAKECHKIELLYYLATEQYEHLPTYEESRRRVEGQLAAAYSKDQDMGSKCGKRGRGLGSSSSFTSTLLACGDSFTAVFCPVSQKHTSNENEEYKVGFPDDASAIGEEARRRNQFPPISSEGRQPDDCSKTVSSVSSRGTRQSVDPDGIKSVASLLDGEDEVGAGHVPRKMSKFSPEFATGIAMDFSDADVPPLPHVRRHSDYDLQRALFLSGLQVDLPEHWESTYSSTDLGSISEQEPFAPPGAKKREQAAVLTVGMLSKCYHEDFDTLRNGGRVIVRRLPTYQGRIPGSTNGCTVIAPLLCIHHFLNESKNPDDGLPDEAIVQVIDEETPNILPLVRQNLGLVKDAFLIPADANESLMQQHYMCQEQFLTVCGGNILDEKHLQPFLDQLNVAGPKKMAASFFFHEHVITILQLRRGSDSVWFDVIDSLPHEETLLRIGETSTNGSASDLGSTSRRSSDAALSSGQHESLRFESEAASSGGYSEEFLVDHVPPSQAARIRCMGVECLKTTLLWYACSVFTAGNRAYIDAYEWDEMLSDFDPRVFQAFIWTEA